MPYIQSQVAKHRQKLTYPVLARVRVDTNSEGPEIEVENVGFESRIWTKTQSATKSEDDGSQVLSQRCMVNSCISTFKLLQERIIMMQSEKKHLVHSGKRTDETMRRVANQRKATKPLI